MSVEASGAAPFAMNSFRGKQILALLRDGDFAHAGEEEAIELTLREVPKNPERAILDAGCGRGGTAAYMQRNRWGRVTGIDIEPRSIAHARNTHPQLRFSVCDIEDANERLRPVYELVTLFDVLYALTDHARALAALASVSTPGATLAIFTYTDPGAYQASPLVDAERPFLPHPPKPAEIQSTLPATGWEVRRVESITAHYERWYATLVAKINAKRGAVEDLAGLDGYSHVHRLYSGLWERFRDGRLGGLIILAERVSGERPARAAR